METIESTVSFTPDEINAFVLAVSNLGKEMGYQPAEFGILLHLSANLFSEVYGLKIKEVETKEMDVQ